MNQAGEALFFVGAFLIIDVCFLLWWVEEPPTDLFSFILVLIGSIVAIAGTILTFVYFISEWY